MAIPQFDPSKAGAQQQLNDMFSSISAYFLFTISWFETVGMKLTINGGRFKGQVVADAALTLTTNSTTYVEADATTGAVSMNTSGFTSGKIAIGIATTNTEGVTGWDPRFNVASAPTA